MASPSKAPSSGSKKKGPAKKKASASKSSSTELAIRNEDTVLSAFAASCKDMAEKDAVVQWLGSLVGKCTAEELPPASSSAPSKYVLPGAIVRTAVGKEGLVARVSQNERWVMWGSWGSTYPGHLMLSDPAAFSSEDLKLPIQSPADDVPSEATELPDFALPPAGFEWAPGSSWHRDGHGDTWIGDPDHDVDRCEHLAPCFVRNSEETLASLVVVSFAFSALRELRCGHVASSRQRHGRLEWKVRAAAPLGATGCSREAS